MAEWGRVSVGGALILGAVVAVGSIVVVFGGEAAISRTEFCVSCHSETYPYEELKKSSHWGALGADPGCKDCHVPQGLANFPLAMWTHVMDGVPFLIEEFTVDYSTIENSRRAAARGSLQGAHEAEGLGQHDLPGLPQEYQASRGVG